LLAPFADQRRIQALPPQIGAAFTVFARLLIGMQMGNLVRRGERATAPRPVGSGVRWIHRFIVVHRGNRGAGHGVPIRISPCVRPICCEPVDSTHPDTQGNSSNPAWFELDTAGQRIQWGSYPGHWQMTVWDSTYRQRWTDNEVVSF